jgi:hypothetical protein
MEGLQPDTIRPHHFAIDFKIENNVDNTYMNNWQNCKSAYLFAEVVSTNLFP